MLEHLHSFTPKQDCDELLDAIPISGDFDLLDPTGGGHEIARVVAVAIAFALGTTFSPSGSNKRIQFLAHDDF